MTIQTKPASSVRGGYLLTYRHQLVLIALTTAVTIAAGWTGLVILERRLIAASGETIATLATAVASNIDLLLEERYRDVQTMAALIASSSAPPAAIDVFQQQTPSYLWIGMADRTGRVSYATDPTSVGQNVARSEWYLAVHRGSAAYVGDVRPDQMT